MTLAEARARNAADPLGFARQRFRLPDATIYLDGNSLGVVYLSDRAEGDFFTAAALSRRSRTFCWPFNTGAAAGVR